LPQLPPPAGSVPRRSTWAGVAFACIVTFALGLTVLLFGGMPGDTALLDAALESRTPALVDASLLAARIGMFDVMAAMVTALVAVLALTRHYRAAAIAAIANLGSYLLNNLLKWATARPRPDGWEPLADHSSWAFPSGHAMSAATLAATAVLLTWHTRARIPVLVLGTAFTLWAGGSRVVMGVHYPSDVLAGILLGPAVAAGTWLLLVRDADSR
jgi:undecaprenyl-diphosphatase